jgi:hypothetical protein
MLGKKAAGGPVSPGASYVVGEVGPEIFTPNTPGHIYPNYASRQPSAVPAPPGATYSNINNSLNAQAEINLTDPTKLSPAQQRIVRNMMQAELQEFLARNRRAGVR